MQLDLVLLLTWAVSSPSVPCLELHKERRQHRVMVCSFWISIS